MIIVPFQRPLPCKLRRTSALMHVNTRAAVADIGSASRSIRLDLHQHQFCIRHKEVVHSDPPIESAE
jgi:hypothetical protein